jgi:hypothetical protein
VISSSIYGTAPKGAVYVAFAIMAALAMLACTNDIAPSRRVGPGIAITPVTDSAFEGDVVRVTARVYDDAGVEIPTAPVAWTVNDTTLAAITNAGSLSLLRPGIVRITARSGGTVATYDLAIRRLVVESVELPQER